MNSMESSNFIWPGEESSTNMIVIGLNQLCLNKWRKSCKKPPILHLLQESLTKWSPKPWLFTWSLQKINSKTCIKSIDNTRKSKVSESSRFLKMN